MDIHSNPTIPSHLQSEYDSMVVALNSAVTDAEYGMVFPRLAELYTASNAHTLIYGLLIEFLGRSPSHAERIFELVNQNSDDPSLEHTRFRVKRSKIYRELNLARTYLEYETVFYSLKDLLLLQPTDDGLHELLGRLADMSPKHIARINDLYTQLHGREFRESRPVVTLPSNIGFQVRRLLAMAQSILRIGNYERAIELCNEAESLLAAEHLPIIEDVVILRDTAQTLLKRRQEFGSAMNMVYEGDWVGGLAIFDKALAEFPNDEMFVEGSRRIRVALDREHKLLKRFHELQSPYKHRNELQALATELSELAALFGSEAKPTSRQRDILKTIRDFLDIPIQAQAESAFGSPLTETQFKSDIFMVMPFSRPFDATFREVIVPTIQAQGLSVKRGDDFYSKHSIMLEVWSAICNSRIILADCSGRNPNVFYELGIAHTLGKPVIMLTQRVEEIPFDLRHLRFIVYDNNKNGLNKLKLELASAIQQVIQNLEQGKPFYTTEKLNAAGQAKLQSDGDAATFSDSTFLSRASLSRLLKIFRPQK